MRSTAWSRKRRGGVRREEGCCYEKYEKYEKYENTKNTKMRKIRKYENAKKKK